MTCRGVTGDYLCPGWVARTVKMRARDGNRCRGCNRTAEDIRLEVHHRIYGEPGPCGQCYLTAVEDDDLSTLCIDCHDGITDVRRRVRYGARTIDAEQMPTPLSSQAVIRVRSDITVEFVSAPSECGVVVKRSFATSFGRD